MIPLSFVANGLALIGAAMIGWGIRGMGAEAAIERAKSAVAACEAERQKDARAAAEETARRLAAAQAAEQSAVRTLQATKHRLATTEQRLKESLYALPTAGRCGLSGPARGLLNRAIAGDELPARAAEPLGAASTPAADTGGSTEAEVGGWIADALRAWGECRARIDAIREWDEVTHGR